MAFVVSHQFILYRPCKRVLLFHRSRRLAAVFGTHPGQRLSQFSQTIHAVVYSQLFDVLSAFPVPTVIYLFYLTLANSLSSYRSVPNDLSILTHVNRSLGCNLTFLSDYDVYLSQRAVRCLLGDYVARKEPITIDILLRIFSFLDFSNPLHFCMCALFLVTFFSFLRISNLVSYILADVRDPKRCYLRLSSVTFTAQGALLRVSRIKTIQFQQRVLE